MARFELWIASVILALFMGASFWRLAGDHIMGFTPYHSVNVVMSEIDNGKFNLVADITTTDCIFRLLSVHGHDFDGIHILPWEDNDGLGQNYTRLSGDHTVRISADLQGRDVDEIEVRTRHRCGFDGVDESGEPIGGVDVDKIFVEFKR